MPLNPIAFTDRVVRSFLRYQLTAYPFADPRLDQQMRDLLSLTKTRATPLLKGPYLTLSRPFQQGCPVQKLTEEGVLHPLLKERLPEGIHNVYLHQEQAIRAINAGKPTLVSTGTGSGKTECFLYPIISRCLQLREQGAQAGITAVLVYPMNALAEDQLLRLRGLLAGTGISFGMYVGKTPQARGDVSGRRLPSGASRADYEKAVEDARKRGSGETVYPAEEICSRDEMRAAGNQPRILLTNVNQLELLLTRQTDVELFSGARLDFLVFDEAHTFTGAQGAETACLIRRLLRFCDKKQGETTCIATSATIVDPNDSKAAKRFASRFFGVEIADVVTVGESYAAQIWPEKRWTTPAPADPARVLQMCVEAVDGTDEDIHSALIALSGQAIRGGESVASELYRVLSEGEPVYQLTKILEKPLALSETAERLAQVLGRESTEEEVLSWLILGAAAAKENRPLLRPVVHAFIRGIGGATVTFPGPGAEPTLHFSAEPVKGEELGFRMPVSTCTTCGQHYFSTHLHDFHHTTRAIGGGQSTGEARYWEPLESAKGGTRSILIDELVSGESLPADKVVQVYGCRQCGTLHDRSVSSCGHCGRGESLVLLHSIQTKPENEGYLGRCLACDSNGRRIGSGFREPARPVKTTAVADVHVLAQDMINNLDPQRLLVFCDNRQDAAFQAGWMRDHARRFRLRSLIAEELKKGAISVGDLTVALSGIFAKEESLSRALLPEVWRVAPADAQQTHGKEREKFLRMAVLREITQSPRQVLGLEPWGRMRVDYKDLTPRLPFIVAASRSLRLSPEEVCDGAATVLDYLRRQRVLLDPVHKTFSKYWSEGDSEIQNGYLPHMDPPKGTKISRDASDNESYVVHWLTSSGDTYLKQAIRKWGVDDASINEFANELFTFFKEKGWLVPVNLIGSKGRALPGQSGLFQIDSAKLELVPGHGVWKCKRCSRRTARRTPRDLCPAWRCSGVVEFQNENADDYNLQLLDGNYDLIRPEEHTAMVPHERRERIENWFKDPKSKATNCLVCTQTLEMGVDIGALDAVLMRNVPPLPANYWQRVGRAGRRNRMAVDVTYCRDISHDRSYFYQPEKLLAGRVDAPAFNLSNPLMVRRHIHAAILTRLHQEARTETSLLGLLDLAFPKTVRPWLFEGSQIRAALPDLQELAKAIMAKKNDLLSHIKEVFAAGWPAEDASVVEESVLKEAIDGFTGQLQQVMKRLQRRLHWAHQTVNRLNAIQIQTGTLDPGDEAIRRRCERYMKRIKGEMRRRRNEGEGQDETVTYSVLALEGFLPGYGLERGSVMGSAEIPFWESGNAGELKLPRPPLMALREYVPGNLIYANGHRFVSRRYQLQPAEERDISAIEVSVERSSIREVEINHVSGQTTRTLQSMPLTDVDLVHFSQISDEEDYRFQMGVAVMGVERPRHSGGKALGWGMQEIHLMKGQHLRMANVGSNSEIQRRVNFGYLICSVCGDSVSPMGSDAQKAHFRLNHKDRCGNAQRDTAHEMAIHADIVSDVLKVPGFTDQTEAYSVLEAIRSAATSCLEMAQEDIQILVMGHMEGSGATGYLLDPMPGGSGLLEQLIERFAEVRTRAIDISMNCPSGCQTSCTDCLQTYRNSFYHPYLDRHRAHSFLDSSAASIQELRNIPAQIIRGEEPKGDNAPVNAAERRLRRLFLAAGFPEAQWQEQLSLGVGHGTTTPDVIFRPEDSDLRPVAVYLDGMSSALHGNAQTAAKDQSIRARLRELNWEIISITAHELHDAEAMRKHFRTLARYLERDDIRSVVTSGAQWYQDSTNDNVDTTASLPGDDFPFGTVPENLREHFKNCVPIFRDLKIAAGNWGEEAGGFADSLASAEEWVSCPEGVKPTEHMFIAKVTGKSMEPKVPDGSWCLFGAAPAGSRKGKDLLVWHESIRDPEGMGQFTLKRYSSDWIQTADGARQARIVLQPLNCKFSAIELLPTDEGSVRIVAELVKVFS
jgi:ATP-dependent helicase YprA (DUF1998 family)/rubrerythrin